MRLGPPLPAVVLARAVAADVEAQAAELAALVPVDLVQLRSPQFLVQPLLLELPLVLVAARLRLAEVALLAAVVKVVEAAVALLVVEGAAVVLLVVVPAAGTEAVRWPRVLKCRAWRSSTCC